MSFPLEIQTIPYRFFYLMPALDPTTIFYHYQIIYNGNKRRLNAIIATNPQLQNKSLEQLYFEPLPNTSELTKNTIRSLAAELYNHDLYFATLTPQSQSRLPETGPLRTAINQTYGSFAQFTEILVQAAESAGSSGWVFICTGEQQPLHLEIVREPRIPNTQFITPIAVVDIYEHAYYLKYATEVQAYVRAWLTIQDYRMIEQNLIAAQAKNRALRAR